MPNIFKYHKLFSFLDTLCICIKLPQYKRLFVPVIVVCLFINQVTRELTINVLADAFWQVSVFVAFTLAIYHGLGPKLLNFDKTVKHGALKQVISASALGSLPGCGGAIIVITQYVQGKVTFGAVVSVLTATMGDAAFLLLAAKPLSGLFVVLITFVVGIVSGVIVNKLHNEKFINKPRQIPLAQCSKKSIPINKHHLQGVFWQILMVPTTLIALLTAFQVDIDSFFSLHSGVSSYVGASLAIITVSLWAINRDVTSYESLVSEDPKGKTSRIFQRVAIDTNFVTSWVIVAFLSFELIMLYGDFNLEELFSIWPVAVPMIAVFIGMIPGCGPQIITTSLYISDVIPMSAQLGNAISNDGDALFPAIAIAPKVAVLATLYSTVPAIIVAYGYFLLFE